MGNPFRQGSNAWIETDRREQRNIVIVVVVLVAALLISIGVVIYALME